MKKGEIDLPLTIFVGLGIIFAGLIGYFLFTHFFVQETTQTDFGVGDLNLTIQNVFVSDADSIVVELKKNSGDAEISGIKFILSGENGDEEIVIENVSFENEQTESFVLMLTNLSLEEIDRISVIPITKTRSEKIADNYVFPEEESVPLKENETIENFSTKCVPESRAVSCGDAVCGTKVDTCEKEIICGVCSASEKCQEHKCVPKTCEDICLESDYNCGGCGCGNCAVGQECTNSATGGICQTVSCAQRCASAEKNCGTYQDCLCGICAIGEECSDLENGGVCKACTETCSSHGYNCGFYSFCGKINNCGSCLIGQTCSNGKCCSNDCSLKAKKCSGNGYQICGNYDADSCSEWSSVISCPTGQNCFEGNCVEGCSNECTLGAKKCSGTGYQTCGNYDEDSCLEWGSVTSCSSEMGCYKNECVNQKVLHSLLVIVDFQNSKLEDYTGEGVKSISDIEGILDKMKSHWEWMSVGTSVQSWDIVRVTLPKKLTKGEIYPCYFTSPCGWVAFRDEIVTLAKKQINPTLYDSNKDGVIDNLFAIVSSGENSEQTGYNYIMGGASQNKGARIFLDPQGSDSVKRQAYGNFNHEIGHGLGLIGGNGLPDIYGSYDTLSYLTLMSNSWPVPPFGFSAYEKIRLGWVIPTLATSTQKNILLLPAEENLQAVKIPTDNSKEYFLVEYRKKPQSGFGSTVLSNFNGLAIYHVNEGQTEDNRASPPFIYLEPADGENVFGTAPEEKDFWFPGNSASTGIFYAKKWKSNNVVFRIENIRWSGQGILFDVVF